MTSASSSSSYKVVIVGAGLAGLSCASKLLERTSTVDGTVPICSSKSIVLIVGNRVVVSTETAAECFNGSSFWEAWCISTVLQSPTPSATRTRVSQGLLGAAEGARAPLKNVSVCHPASPVPG